MEKKSYCQRRIGIPLTLGFSLLLSPLVYANNATYDQLVTDARNGQTGTLLAWLQAESHRDALSPSQVADWLQVSLWAGQDRQVIDIWRQYQHRMSVPLRGRVAAARAWRNLRQWGPSLVLWEQALAAEPRNDEIRSGWIMTLADSRQDVQALNEARKLVTRAPSAAHNQVLAYVLSSQGKPRDGLLALTRAWEQQPGNTTLHAGLVDLWTADRVAAPALALSSGLTLSPAQQRRLALNDAAEWVRMAQMPGRGEGGQFQAADGALARYGQLLTRWKDLPDARQEYREARIDRLGALLARKRYREVTQEYDALLAEDPTFPAYAEHWVAFAQLAQRQPGDARQLLSHDPTDAGAELFYATLESEDFPAASKQVDAMVATTPYQLNQYGSPVPVPNDQWLTARILRAQYLLAANDLPAAQTESARLAQQGPGNQGLVINYAGVLAARGLNRQAEVQLKIAEVLEPTNLELERQQAYVAQSLQEWRQFDLLTDDVVARSPLEPASRELARARDIHHGYELRVEGGKGISSDSPISGSHDFSWRSVLYGPPVADNWRPFAGFSFATGQFEEGKGYDRALLGGLEYRARDLWLEGELANQNFGHGNKVGARLSGWYDLNDHWRLGGEVARLSPETPLRALTNGITANGGQAFVRWYQNERREYQFSVAQGDFSDGNRRMEYGLSGKERLWTTPYLTLDLLPGLSASTNSKKNAPYYNPQRDLSATGTLSADHILYRHYDRVWSQQLMAGAGSYWQQGQDRGLIASLAYGQRVQWNNVLDAGAMVSWDKRPYDGVRERNLSVAFDMNLRF